MPNKILDIDVIKDGIRETIDFNLESMEDRLPLDRLTIKDIPLILRSLANDIERELIDEEE